MGGVWKITLNETIFLSTRDFEDDYVGCLQRTVHGIKQSRRMEERYMLTELLMQDERRAGREEGRIEGQIVGYRESILELLAETGPVLDMVRKKIMQEKDIDQLRAWVKLAAKADTIEQFVEKM